MAKDVIFSSGFDFTSKHPSPPSGVLEPINKNGFLVPCSYIMKNLLIVFSSFIVASLPTIYLVYSSLVKSGAVTQNEEYPKSSAKNGKIYFASYSVYALTRFFKNNYSFSNDCSDMISSFFRFPNNTGLQSYKKTIKNLVCARKWREENTEKNSRYFFKNNDTNLFLVFLLVLDSGNKHFYLVDWLWLIFCRYQI